MLCPLRTYHSSVNQATALSLRRIVTRLLLRRVHNVALVAVANAAVPLLCSNLRNVVVKLALADFGLPWRWCARSEHLLNFLERFASGLGIGDECLGGRAEAKHTEDDESLPGDIVESWGHEETKSEVEELKASLAYWKRIFLGQETTYPVGN